jgi:two-component system chemotaxis response regulator CheY
VPSILIAEDEAHILRVLSMWLGRHGYDILEAPDGAAALDILSAQPVNMIISDMNMPCLDGLGLARAVREDLRMDVPFVLLSARCDQDQLARRAEPYRVCLYPKPFTPSRLVATVGRLLSGVSAQGS